MRGHAVSVGAKSPGLKGGEGGLIGLFGAEDEPCQ